MTQELKTYGKLAVASPCDSEVMKRQKVKHLTCYFNYILYMLFHLIDVKLLQTPTSNHAFFSHWSMYCM